MPVEEDVKSMELAGNFAIFTMKTQFLLNGGAIVALLSFASGMKDKAATLNYLATGIELYVWGLITAFTCVVFSYAAQEANTQRYWKFFEVLRGVAVLASIASIVLFALGSYSAINAIRLIGS